MAQERQGPLGGAGLETAVHTAELVVDIGVVVVLAESHGGSLQVEARLAETLVGAQLVELLVGDVGALLHELEGFLVNVG